MSFWCQKYDQIDVLRPFLFDCETQKLYNFLAFSFAEVRKTKKFKKLLLWKKNYIFKNQQQQQLVDGALLVKKF